MHRARHSRKHAAPWLGNGGWGWGIQTHVEPWKMGAPRAHWSPHALHALLPLLLAGTHSSAATPRRRARSRLPASAPVSAAAGGWSNWEQRGMWAVSRLSRPERLLGPCWPVGPRGRAICPWRDQSTLRIGIPYGIARLLLDCDTNSAHPNKRWNELQKVPRPYCLAVAAYYQCVWTPRKPKTRLRWTLA